MHAREEARAAYRAWAEADRPDRAAAYAVYRAAEEREEAAARGVRRVLSTGLRQRPVPRPVTLGGSPWPPVSSCAAP